MVSTNSPCRTQHFSAEIMDAWDAAEIDAGAVWGTARDYILEGGEGAKRPASTLLSSGVISE